MDFSMFDDEADDGGQEIDSFCARCKTDTPHTVVSRYDEEIRRVRCNTCDDVHAFRRPRGEDGEEPAEQPVRKKLTKAKPTWEQMISKRKSSPRSWGPDEVFCELDVIAHAVFGIGFVSELIGQNKIEVTFQNDKRILIHNRRLLPLHVVQRQRQEAEARARADGKAKAKEAREAKAAAREAARLAKTHESELDDMDLPDMLADDEEIPVLSSPKSSHGGKANRLSAKELAALDDDEDDDLLSDSGDDESPARGSARKAKGVAAKPARGKSSAQKASESDDLEDSIDDEPKSKKSQASGKRDSTEAPSAAAKDSRKARASEIKARSKSRLLETHEADETAPARSSAIDGEGKPAGKRGRKPADDRDPKRQAEPFFARSASGTSVSVAASPMELENDAANAAVPRRKIGRPSTKVALSEPTEVRTVDASPVPDASAEGRSEKTDRKARKNAEETGRKARHAEEPIEKAPVAPAQDKASRKRPDKATRGTVVHDAVSGADGAVGAKIPAKRGRPRKVAALPEAKAPERHETPSVVKAAEEAAPPAPAAKRGRKPSVVKAAEEAAPAPAAKRGRKPSAVLASEAQSAESAEGKPRRGRKPAHDKDGGSQAAAKTAKGPAKRKAAKAS